MKKFITLLAVLSVYFGVFAATYTNLEVDESVRKSLAFSTLETYLPEGQTYTTPSLSVGTTTKMLVTTSVSLLRDFAVVDTGGGDMRYQYQGSDTRPCSMHVAVGVTVSQPNVTFKLGIYQNDDGFIPSLVGEQFHSSGTEAGRFILSGYVVLQPLDTLSFWGEIISGSTSTLTFQNMSISIVELN